MPDYRLSKAAKQDLISIARYGDENFGVAQSDRYRDRLKKRFSILAKHSERYPAETISVMDTGAMFAAYIPYTTGLNSRG